MAIRAKLTLALGLLSLMVLIVAGMSLKALGDIISVIDGIASQTRSWH